MSTGSGLFSSKGPVQARFIEGKGGVPGEVADLRQDVKTTFAAMAALCVEEFTNALATAANNMMAATASVSGAAVRLLPAVTPAVGKLTQATVTNLAAASRQILLTTAGATPAHQPSTATLVGKDERGKPQTEVVPLKQEAGAFLSTLFFSDLEYIDLAADGTGTGATLAIGLGGKIGLSHKVVARAGRNAVIQEVAGGSVVTNGVVLRADEGVAATVTGTVDLVTPVPVMPTTETLVLGIDGVTVTTTFATPADLAAIVAAINAAATAVNPLWTAIASVSTNYLMLTSPTTGISSSLDIKAASTSLVILGFTAGLLKGVGNGAYGSYTPNAALDGSTDFALYYEYDGAAA